jgi:excisionase family DNA binding protein
MTTITPEALTVPEVMAALRLSRGLVYELIRSKELPSFKVGRCRRVSTEDLAAFMRLRTERES